MKSKNLWALVAMCFAIGLSGVACTGAYIDTGIMEVQPNPAPHTGGGGGGSICTPQCSGRVCGSNGCGGSCGNCNGSDVCGSSGTCASPSTGTPYCPAQVEYCSKVDNETLRCHVLDGSHSGGQCNTRAGNFAFTASDGLTHNFVGGEIKLICGQSKGPSHWMLRPKNKFNQIGAAYAYEDWSCELIGGGGNPTPNPTPAVGEISCYMERTDSTTWMSLSGGGLKSDAVGDTTKAFDMYTFWGNNVNNRVDFKVFGGEVGFCVLPQISGQQWARGGVQGFTEDQVIGSWRVVCGTQTFSFSQATPLCVANKLPGVGNACRFTNAPQDDDRRLCGRNR